MLPRRLVFTGGGTRCLVFVEALIVLEKAGILDRVNEYWGTSAGAFIATLMAVCETVASVKECMRSTDYVKFRNVDVNNLLNINKSWGLDNGDSLVGEIERILNLVKPGASNMTMMDLPSLTIVISNLSTHEIILCSAATHPSLRVVDAIRASMSLPLFFRPYIHKDTEHIWVDGAVGANFPWMLLPSEGDRRQSLGFTFEHGTIQTPTTFPEYIFSMIHFEGPKKIANLKALYPKNILWFPQLPFPAWFMRLMPADFDMLTSIGEKVAVDWLASRQTSAAPSCSPYPRGTNGNHPPCADHHTPSPDCLQCRRAQMSDNPKSSNPEPLRDSSPPQLPSDLQRDRRWSW